MLVTKGIYTNKSFKETSVFFFFFFFFIIPNKFDVQFMSHQDTDNSVHVSFIPGCHRLMPVLANYLFSHVVHSSVTVRQNILANIPIYNLSPVAA